MHNVALQDSTCEPNLPFRGSAVKCELFFEQGALGKQILMRNEMVYFDNDLWSTFKQNGGVYLQGSGIVLEDIEMKDGNLTDMECLVNYLAPAYFGEDQDEVHFFVEPGISQYYCGLIGVCPEECKSIMLEGKFTYEPNATVNLLDMRYSEYKCDEEGEKDPDNGFCFGIGDTQGRMVLNDVIVFPASEENNGIVDMILFVPDKLVPQSMKREYKTKSKGA